MLSFTRLQFDTHNLIKLLFDPKQLEILIIVSEHKFGLFRIHLSTTSCSWFTIALILNIINGLILLILCGISGALAY